MRKPREKVNWRIGAGEKGGEVVAIEPNREFEHAFEGGSDPLMDAIEYAAKQIREGQS